MNKIDISLCLKWPHGILSAHPIQIKGTQLEAQLKASWRVKQIGIKSRGSQPGNKKQKKKEDCL